MSGNGVVENRSVNVSRKSPAIQEGMQGALQAAEASCNNGTGVLSMEKNFHFSNYKSKQIKSSLHFMWQPSCWAPKTLYTEGVRL